MRSGNQPTPVAAGSAEIALFPLNAVLYPGGPLPLRIFEPRYVNMVRGCAREDAPFGVVLILAGAEASAAVTSTAPVGTSARIVDFYPLPDGLLGIYCLGGRKFRLLRRWQQSDGLNMGEVLWLPDEPAVELPADYQHLGHLVRKILPELGELYEPVEKRLEDAAWVGYRLAEILPVSLTEKQEWLELDDPLERLAALNPLIRREAT
ncbi:MAG TPA: LON peptidase substrate-binding domain-containing protein [Steroidobacteraceae bacterium]|nr:LON peptidase substrate-binding domain-containing protein [Steroidobacteraceae bacterium]